MNNFYALGEASVPIQLITDKPPTENQIDIPSDLSIAVKTVETSQAAGSKAEGVPPTGSLLTSLSAEDIIQVNLWFLDLQFMKLFLLNVKNSSFQNIIFLYFQVPGLDVIPLNLDSSQILWSEGKC